MRKLGVFFTCFNELEATRVSLNYLKMVYPDIPVYLVHEGDMNFSFLEREISNLVTYKVPDTMSDVLKIESHNYQSPEQQEAIKIALLAVIKRLERAIEYTKSEYILMLDPDAVVRGQLTIPDGVGLLGCRGNKHIWAISKLNDVLKQHGGIELSAWGATPAIFNVEKFLRAKDKLLNTPGLVDELCWSFYWAFAHDILLASMFSLIGEEETMNPDIVQCEWNPNWQQTNCPLLHQFRYYYPKRTSKYHVNQ